MKFWKDNASYPYRSHELWFLVEGVRWAKFNASEDLKGLVAKVNREDLWRDAANGARSAGDANTGVDVTRPRDFLRRQSLRSGESGSLSREPRDQAVELSSWPAPLCGALSDPNVVPLSTSGQGACRQEPGGLPRARAPHPRACWPRRGGSSGTCCRRCARSVCSSGCGSSSAPHPTRACRRHRASSPTPGSSSSTRSSTVAASTRDSSGTSTPASSAWRSATCWRRSPASRSACS